MGFILNIDEMNDDEVISLSKKIGLDTDLSIEQMRRLLKYRKVNSLMV